MQNIYKETMKEIINKQADLLYTTLKLQPGFNLREIIDRLGGKVEIYENDELGEGVEATIVPIEDNSSFKISYRKQGIDESYIRFAIAHELGHLFLHMAHKDNKGRYKIDGAYNRKSQNISLLEWEAEEFAAAFLMPEKVFRMKVEEAEENSQIQDKFQWLAKTFRVPYKSVITRGKSLGIW